MAIRHLSDLPEPLRTRLAGQDLIVFDGTCLLCEGAFRFVLRRDRTERFRFATAQSALGQRLMAALDLPTTRFDTNVVIVGDRIHTHAAGIGAVLGALGGGWALLGWTRHLPGWSTDWAYRLVARNRFRLFGRRETCLVPDRELRARFMT